MVLLTRDDAVLPDEGEKKILMKGKMKMENYLNKIIFGNFLEWWINYNGG